MYNNLKYRRDVRCSRPIGSTRFLIICIYTHALNNRRRLEGIFSDKSHPHCVFDKHDHDHLPSLLSLSRDAYTCTGYFFCCCATSPLRIHSPIDVWKGNIRAKDQRLVIFAISSTVVWCYAYGIDVNFSMGMWIANRSGM